MKAESKRFSGVALVIVLASLVFLVALAVGFLMSSRTELKSSKTYSDGGRAQLLAQSAINLAMAQIAQGTKGVDATGGTLAWASQPGMIRTYDTAGNPAAHYKLYSWDVMTASGAFDPFAPSEEVPPDWFLRKAFFTDLNQPIAAGSGSSYPIIDGNNLTATTDDGDKTYAAPGIEGFSVSATETPLSTSTGASPVPMPVKWLYVLADGTIIAPSGGTGNTATFPATHSPTAANPITGRVAFWTDDESCKVNINTASEGTYWDTPRTSRSEDGKRGLAERQPAQREYQRYPGHPAMTSLGTVFPGLALEKIYDIAPRVKGGIGTSLGGTVRGSAVITPDSDRLYASVDELVFKQPVSSDPARSENDASTITKDTLEWARFFITASSRAPDVNLFNQPRVCMWPIHESDASDRRTPFDKLIAFCSTVNNKPYYFQRSHPLSPTVDLPTNPSDDDLGRNRKLLNYLRSLASLPIPGFGASFEEKYSTATGVNDGKEIDQILVEMFDYIRSTNLTDTSTAGLVSFTSLASQNKIGSGTGLVAPIFDDRTGTRGFGRFPTIKGGALVFYGVMDDDNPVTNARATKAPPGEIAIRAFFLPQLFTPAQGYPGFGHKYIIRVTGLDALEWEGINSLGGPVHFKKMGFPAVAQVRMSNAPSSSVWPYGEMPLGGIVGDMQAPAAKDGQNMTTTDAYTLLTTSAVLPVTSGTQVHPTADSGTIYVKKNTPFKFKGGDVTIELLTPTAPNASLGLPLDLAALNLVVVQSVTLRFPPGADDPPIEIPAPKEAPVLADGMDYRRLVKSGTKVRFGATGIKERSPLIREEDVVRSIVPASGDLRLVAARKTILPSTPGLFKPHSKYGDTTQTHAHILRTSKNAPYYGASGGRLVNVAYNNSDNQYFTSLTGEYLDKSVPQDSGVVPDLNGVSLGGSGSLPGDWDNGVGHTPDGPYINKPDEGDASFSSGNGAYYYWVNNPVGSSLFSPNRMIPSAGMFGSLPTGVWANQPWQTLQFRPGPAGHPGLVSPKDHLFLDLFHMPVVEPYAISEPLSTAGRINMNYQIVPFTYIKRNTGLHAVLKSEKVISIPDSQADSYKRHQQSDVGGTSLRLDVNRDETLEGFEQRFSTGDIFRSASEICDIHIVPDGATYSGMTTYWNDKRLTGDNSRERIYTTIYPRLTTKSNVFTIHFRAQALKKIGTGDPAVWNENIDKVMGEFRGSQTVERYVDPNNPLIDDYTEPAPPAPAPISSHYNFRVVQARQFGQ